MKREFGRLPNGDMAYLYTIRGGGLEAYITDLGATLQRLYVPGKNGNLADVVLGFDNPAAYINSAAFYGTVVGRNCNRLKDGQFELNGDSIQLGINDGRNNLHSGPDFFKDRLWNVEQVCENSIQLSLNSPDGDQGFPGTAKICVTYALEDCGTLRISYDAVCAQDTVFNMTNHSYFNLAGHDRPEKAMDMLLSMTARYFTPSNEESIPTGEKRLVDGTPMDFQTPKPIGRDINANYDALVLQNGYDHNFEVFSNPCAVLSDPVSGRCMTVSTDCPGIQLYSGNFLADELGKDGVKYGFRSGICLETQYYPNALNHQDWKKPIVAAGVPYHSETKYVFSTNSNAMQGD